MRYRLTSMPWEDIRKNLKVRNLTTVKVCFRFPELNFTIAELTFRRWDGNLSTGSVYEKRLEDKGPDNKVERVPSAHRYVF